MGDAEVILMEMANVFMLIKPGANYSWDDNLRLFVQVKWSVLC